MKQLYENVKNLYGNLTLHVLSIKVNLKMSKYW